MHIAVIHNRKGIIDWLMMKEEGRHGLDLLNNDGFTPLTLAARIGRVEIFQHILYRHMSQIAWTYGRVGLFVQLSDCHTVFSFFWPGSDASNRPFTGGYIQNA
jgi:hypothetical protein